MPMLKRYEERERDQFDGRSVMVWVNYPINKKQPLSLSLVTRVLCSLHVAPMSNAYMFQHKNASSYSAFITQKFLNANINIMRWPAMNPDLNLDIWDNLDTCVRHSHNQPRSRQELEKTLTAELNYNT